MRISDWSSDVCSSDLRGARLQIFKAVAGNDERLRRLFQPVIGAADPLGQPRRALWRAHLDDEIDVAPVDAEVEACRRDQRATPAFAPRSGVRRVGKECVSPCRSRWAPGHSQKKAKRHNSGAE